MQFKSTWQNWLPAVLAGLALAGSTSSSLAQTWANPKTFDYSAGSWITWNNWGLQSTPDNRWIVQDPTLDAADDPNSGSLRFDVPFTGNSGDQIMTFGTLHDGWGWDGAVVINCVGVYKNLVFDFKLDPNTSPTKNNDFGSLAIGLTTLINGNWGQIKLADYKIPATATSWTHVVLPINQTLPNLDTVSGYYFNMWSGGAFTNTLSFNVDNIWLQPMTNEPPLAPPTLALTYAQPGLNLIADSPGIYDRQNIRTVSPEYSWVGKKSTPATYSFTIKSYPGTNNPNYELHNYLTPVPYDPIVGPGTIGNGSSPDWDQTNCIFMDLQNKTDGSATWIFRWKTNNIPDGNGTYYSTPLAVINEPAGPLGTWTLTFLNNTNVTMTTPSGLSTNFEYSADKLAGYVDSQGAALPLYYYIGGKANATANIGLTAILSQVSVKGAGTPINENFMNQESLNTNIWELAANSGAVGVQLVPFDAIAWLTWTLPDVGFSLQTNALCSTNGWNDSSATPLQASKSKEVIISGSKPGASQGYYRLMKRSFTKLQVLLPGETAAPGTPTGKTGTPDLQAYGTQFPITVNAVDDTWHLIKLAPNDEIAITSSDDVAVAIPSNASLVSGTQTFNITVWIPEDVTFTATDVTDATKTTNTSATVTVASP